VFDGFIETYNKIGGDTSAPIYIYMYVFIVVHLYVYVFTSLGAAGVGLLICFTFGCIRRLEFLSDRHLLCKHQHHPTHCQMGHGIIQHDRTGASHTSHHHLVHGHVPDHVHVHFPK
jgi:hypothetical protein